MYLHTVHLVMITIISQQTLNELRESSAVFRFTLRTLSTSHLTIIILTNLYESKPSTQLLNFFHKRLIITRPFAFAKHEIQIARMTICGKGTFDFHTRTSKE